MLRRAMGSTPNGLPAVKWLSLAQLAQTAVEVIQATMFARFADKRESMASSPREFYRLPGSDRDIWIDYVADTGDGFDATFATACCLSGVATVTPAEPFADRPGQADLLILGGDEVYPVASAKAYVERLNEVLRMAGRLAAMPTSPPVLALPGNHDWYDGLASFRRNFCESWVMRDGDRQHASSVIDVPPPQQCDDVGGWSAFQSRSYFAAQLSQRWWLWALDSQLDAPIDAEQLAYFREAAKLLGDADVVLCVATPSWLEATGEGVYAAVADTPLYTLLWFIDRVLGPERHRLRLVLTGDQHHYARYSPATDGGSTDFAPELVTCGGGGAFLASTHHLGDTIRAALQPWPSGSGQSVRYGLTSAYPSKEQSNALTARGRFLSAAWRNGWTLPALVGTVDFLLFLTVFLGQPGWFTAATVGVGALLGLYASSGVPTHLPLRRRQQTIAALLVPHTLAHVVAAAVIAAAAWLAPPPLLWIVLPLAFVVLAALGTAVFVTYLHIADRFGCHILEAFSALRIDGYKSHLRLHVTDERIRVHVVGMDAVPRARYAEDLGEEIPEPRVIDTFDVFPSGKHAEGPDPSSPTSVGVAGR